MHYIMYTVYRVKRDIKTAAYSRVQNKVSITISLYDRATVHLCPETMIKW